MVPGGGANTLAQEVKAVRDSSLFDPDWYKGAFNLDWTNRDPAEHFCLTWQENLISPSPNFDICRYLCANPDVALKGTNPLYHYISEGMYENRTAWSQIDLFDKDSVCRGLSLQDSRLGCARIKTGRLAIFAAYSQDYTVNEAIIFYLEQLREVCDTVIFISDNYVPFTEIQKIRHLVHCYICRRHGEYDFGSWKRGLEVAISSGVLAKCDELILCNDSVFGPVYNFKDIFETMSARNCDFWGITKSEEHTAHLQSYFMVFKRQVFEHKGFLDFFSRVTKKASFGEVVQSYELRLSNYLSEFGFRYDTYFSLEFMKDEISDLYHNPGIAEYLESIQNRLLFSASLIRHGFPFVKAKAITRYRTDNYQGTIDLMQALQERSPSLANLLRNDPRYPLDQKFNDISFSIIMPTYNRSALIGKTIDRILAQTFKNFELLIIDDCSDDNTELLINTRYVQEIEKSKIKYIKLPQRKGAAYARNCGLKLASREWVAYMDSDDLPFHYWLESFARAICESPDSNIFYAQIKPFYDHEISGRPYDRNFLLNIGNYINLNVFIHRLDLFKELGGFDISVTRLIDFDIILKYTKYYYPTFINMVLVNYNDGSHQRISSSKYYHCHYQKLRHKYGDIKSALTIIPLLAGNIETNIETHVRQQLWKHGDFYHQIVVYDLHGKLSQNSMAIMAHPDVHVLGRKEIKKFLLKHKFDFIYSWRPGDASKDPFELQWRINRYKPDPA